MRPELPQVPEGDPPRCITCRWFDVAGISLCGHPNLWLSEDGTIYKRSASSVRGDIVKCGVDGQWHEAKPKNPYATDDSILRAQSVMLERSPSTGK